MGLLEKIKTMAGLPPGRINAQGLMSDDKQPSLMRPQSLPAKKKPLEIYKRSGNVTPEGRPMYLNNFGGESSENTIGVTDPRINNNELTHIPSIYDGKILNEKDSMQKVVDANGYDQITGRFITPGGDPEARSKSLDGKYMGMQGGFNTRRDNRSKASYDYLESTNQSQIDSFINWYKPGSTRADGNGYNSLESLEPDFRNKLEYFIKAVYDRTGYMMKIGTVHKDRVTRSPEAQDALFAKGKKVTKAKSFESAHNYGLGADFSIFHPSDKKKVLWDENKFEEIAKIADEYDLQNLTAKRDKFHDPGHFMPKGWKKPDNADDLRKHYYYTANSPLTK